MAKPKQKKGLPKTTGEWEALTGKQVMEKVFGKRGEKALRDEAVQKEAKPRKDYRLPS
jgi:hypothetical protein